MRSDSVNAQEGGPPDTSPGAPKDVAVSYVADATGAESPATLLEVTLGTTLTVSNIRGTQELETIDYQDDVPKTVAQKQIEQRRERYWRRIVHSELRDRLVATMIKQLQRVTGDLDVRYLRRCATRYESFVWKKSANQVQYKQKLEDRIDSLRRQPSHGDERGVERTLRLVEGHHLNLTPSCPENKHDVAEPTQAIKGFASNGTYRRHGPRSSGGRGSRHQYSKRAGKWNTAANALDALAVQRDDLYFAKLRVMKNQYRDEVALVFRELCRINTVIQHSTILRRHESNNLDAFLINLKKIIYLLEQQLNEAGGMIPARKRTVEYLHVVEAHIQQKVLPILYRLRHTYSTILRPIVLHYMKNSFRFH